VNVNSKCWALASVCVLAMGGQSAAVSAQTPSMPAWLNKRMADREKSYNRIEKVEESQYLGRRAFQIFQGKVRDANNEHQLLSDDGKLICEFGGIAGHVVSGNCDIDKIVYVKTLYERSLKDE
jgi:hypothetical protein